LIEIETIDKDQIDDLMNRKPMREAAVIIDSDVASTELGSGVDVPKDTSSDSDEKPLGGSGTQQTIPISIDTSKPEVMELAVKAGASMINDVCALSADGALEMVSSLNVDVCLMHMQGNPRIMQIKPSYVDVVHDIKSFFNDRIEVCVNAGISEDKIVLDPGFGFGKTLNQNLEMLKRLSEFKSFNLPVLVGISRKSMIGTLLDNRNVDGRVSGSVTAAIMAIRNGANVVRVHDVLETKDALTIWQSVNQFKG